MNKFKTNVPHSFGTFKTYHDKQRGKKYRVSPTNISKCSSISIQDKNNSNLTFIIIKKWVVFPDFKLIIDEGDYEYN